MTKDKRPADINPEIDAPTVQTPEDDTEGHSLLSAQLGGVMASDRSREAAKWAKSEQARKRNQAQGHGKDGHR